MVGNFELNRAYAGDCLELSDSLPSNSIDIIVTSPPYWGQRASAGIGTEADPRDYLEALTLRLTRLRRALKPTGFLWLNLGDAYNTPVNWREGDHRWSSLGPERKGLPSTNSAYTKSRFKRKACIDEQVRWLQYGNLLALPYRLVIQLCDEGYFFRAEVIWKKNNPMPEGKCRRPHRAHEGIYGFGKEERHHFQISPPVKSVWEFSNEGANGVRHYSRFPVALPMACIRAFGRFSSEIVVLDPFSGSGTTGVAAAAMGCSYIGFEIDASITAQSNAMLERAFKGLSLPRREQASPATLRDGLFPDLPVS